MAGLLHHQSIRKLQCSVLKMRSKGQHRVSVPRAFLRIFATPAILLRTTGLSCLRRLLPECHIMAQCGVALLISSCAVTPAIQHQYALHTPRFPTQTHHSARATILVSQPEALAGYETESMLYMSKPFERKAFAHNAWTAPPATLLTQPIIQALEASGKFKGIVSSTTPEIADYQLDTQLLYLYQDFTHKPSQLHFAAKIVLSNLKTNQIIGSQVIQHTIPCTANTPQGGVLAANQAVARFTRALMRSMRQVSS